MGMQQIDMSVVGFDLVIAVTSRGLNIALDSMMPQSPINVAYNDLMQPVPPSSATNRFCGKRAVFDPDGNPIDLITLNQGSDHVQLNLTFAGGGGAELLAASQLFKQGVDAWTFLFTVPLLVSVATPADLPAAVSAQIETVTATFPDNHFQTMQVGFDWGNTGLITAQGLGDLEIEQLSSICGMFIGYLAQVSPALSVGYFALCSDETAPATVATSLDLCVTPYQASEPAPSPLDTLLLLFMLGNHSPPSPLPPALFDPGFTWVDDLTFSGAAAISSSVTTSTLLAGMSGLPAVLSPILSADASDGGSLTLSPGNAATFSVWPNPGTPKEVALGVYVYPPVTATAKKTGLTNTVVVGGFGSQSYIHFGVETANTLDLTKIVVQGSCSFDGSFVSTSYFGGASVYEIPRSIWSWSVLLQVQADLVNPGQLDVVVTSADLNSEPVVDAMHSTTWEKVLAALSGSSITYANSVTDLGTAIGNQVADQILPTLKTSLAAASPLLFPGGRTFLFSSPQFNPNFDLVANINFHN